MLNRLNTYILIQLLLAKNVSIFFLLTSKHFTRIQLTFYLHLKFFSLVENKLKFSNLIFNNNTKHSYLKAIEPVIKELIFTTKPLYFFPCSGFEKDAKLINLILNDYRPLLDIYEAVNTKNFKLNRDKKFYNYHPSIIIFTDSLEKRNIISNIKNLRIPSIGLVDLQTINNPFDINIVVPEINNFFKIYYFFLLFKIAVFYKKLYTKLLILNYINFKITYLKKLTLLK